MGFLPSRHENQANQGKVVCFQNTKRLGINNNTSLEGKMKKTRAGKLATVAEWKLQLGKNLLETLLGAFRPRWLTLPLPKKKPVEVSRESKPRRKFDVVGSLHGTLDPLKNTVADRGKLWGNHSKNRAYIVSNAHWSRKMVKNFQSTASFASTQDWRNLLCQSLARK